MADYNGDLKVVSSQLAEITRKVDAIDGKLDPLCDMVSRHDEKIKTNDKEITSLRKKTDAWNAGNSIGLIATAFLSYLRGG
jgi:peptidoglycan hydrolase CwlO-like protein